MYRHNAVMDYVNVGRLVLGLEPITQLPQARMMVASACVLHCALELPEEVEVGKRHIGSCTNREILERLARVWNKDVRHVHGGLMQITLPLDLHYLVECFDEGELPHLIEDPAIRHRVFVSLFQRAQDPADLLAYFA